MDDRDETVLPGALGWRDAPVIEPGDAIHWSSVPKPFTLAPADYAEGCVKAALSLLMKPNRNDSDVRKAHAWLGLAIDKKTNV